MFTRPCIHMYVCLSTHPLSFLIYKLSHEITARTKWHTGYRMHRGLSTELYT